MDLVHRVAAANGIDIRGVDRYRGAALGQRLREVSVTQTFTCGIEQLVNFLAALANEPNCSSTNETCTSAAAADKKKNVTVRLSLSGVVPRKLAAGEEEEGLRFESETARFEHRCWPAW